MLEFQTPYPRVSREKAERALIHIARAVGEANVRVGDDECAAYAGDESEVPPVLPDGVVLARSADDVSVCLRVCNEHGVPVTPRAAGTGKTGGAVPVSGGIVLATGGMNAVKELSAEVEALKAKGN